MHNKQALLTMPDQKTPIGFAFMQKTINLIIAVDEEE